MTPAATLDDRSGEAAEHLACDTLRWGDRVAMALADQGDGVAGPVHDDRVALSSQ
jgi:hypothetical protein